MSVPPQRDALDEANEVIVRLQHELRELRDALANAEMLTRILTAELRRKDASSKN